MGTQVFVRGAVVVFSTVFSTPYQSGTQPSSVSILISYTTDSTTGAKVASPASITASLQSDGVTWLASWDSSVAASGPVDWFLSCNGVARAVDEGTFALAVNSANPDP